jgi:SAM-dependent methyltransferase
MTPQRPFADARRQLVRDEFDDRGAASYARSRAAHPGYRLQRDRVLELLGTQHRRILDVGCGTGEALAAACLAGTLGVGVDLSPSMLRHASPRSTPRGSLHFLAADAGALPLASESFDAIISIGLVEYTWPDQRLFQEFARVLQRGGAVVIAFQHGQCLARRLETVARRVFRRAPAGAIQAIERPRAPDFDRVMTECGFKLERALFCYPQFLSWPLRERLSSLDAWCAHLDPVVGRIPLFGRIYVSRWQRL